MKRVVVLGATGMLGHVVADVLEKNENLEVIKTSRDKLPADRKGTWVKFDAAQVNSPLKSWVDDVDYVVNCIGVIKPHIKEDDAETVANAVVVNSYFPYRLDKLAREKDFTVIQIATDCVFSGYDGDYVESSTHDPRDVYGKTKSLGEVFSPHFIHLRCSIIGPELGRQTSLLEWVLSQKDGAAINGFRNHRWNGITTLAFAEICNGLIEEGVKGGFLQHVVPADTVNKYELLQLIATHFGRDDIEVKKAKGAEGIDRTLRTDELGRNYEMWDLAGLMGAPNIDYMVRKLAEYVENSKL